ncbi:hypothetical protein TA3x_005068 [Tundrisphaera sp. TA3]|uniref:hypothetical protein n=1 Tax=Tundrisphaera sp. TA3 TaxID=3435775 RepID=UPI003EB967AB
MRTSVKPWYRQARDAWYVQIDGKQVKLAKGKANKAEARRVWLALVAKSEASGATIKATVERLTLVECCTTYLSSLKSEGTLRSRKQVC